MPLSGRVFLDCAQQLEYIGLCHFSVWLIAAARASICFEAASDLLAHIVEEL